MIIHGLSGPRKTSDSSFRPCAAQFRAMFQPLGDESLKSRLRCHKKLLFGYSPQPRTVYRMDPYLGYKTVAITISRDCSRLGAVAKLLSILWIVRGQTRCMLTGLIRLLRIVSIPSPAQRVQLSTRGTVYHGHMRDGHGILKRG